MTAQTSPTFISRQVTVGDTTWHLNEWGPAAAQVGDPILFLHGMGAHVGYHANDLAVELALRGHQVLAPDLPGFGATPGGGQTQYETAQLTADLLALADSLGFERMVLAGHSWGGYLAAHLAAAHPERVSALVLLDGGLVDVPPIEYAEALEFAISMDDSYVFETIDELYAEDRPYFQRWSTALETAYEQSMAPIDGKLRMRQRPEDAAAIRTACGQAPVSATHQPLAEAQIPVLLCLPAPAASDVVPLALAAWQALGPRLSVDWYDGCSHFLPQDAGPQIGVRCAEWLARGGAE
ncbi:alpha/beta fold hydrolase [Kribbella sp. NPDC051587]|uniref:alpha/beta fold hydrolase n=1 Tax=Kribbella sp. NPDC051587 TaxID=3364119 RepID=UPI00378E0793